MDEAQPKRRPEVVVVGASAGGVEALSRLAAAQQAQELWGLRAEEVHGQHLTNLDIGLPLDQALARATLSEGSPQEAELDGTNRRGRAITCRVRTSPLVTPSGEPRGVILVMEEQ